VYRYEKLAYQLPSPGWDFTFEELSNWAAEPIEGERICFATEGLNPRDSGWMEAAAVTAHNCFRGPVFSDVITSAEVDSWERCSNRFTERELVKGSEGPFDTCLLLETEYSMRDLDGEAICGGPSQLPGNLGIQSGSIEDQWANAKQTPVTLPEEPRRVGGRYM